jgi:uncharacterized protein YciI
MDLPDDSCPKRMINYIFTYIKNNNMKNIILLFTLIIGLSYSLSAQSNDKVYDSTYAKTLGADAYGMKSYIFVMLTTGDSIINDKKVRDSIFGGHMANMIRMEEMGKLVLAGPFHDNDNGWEGIFVLNTIDLEEAKLLLQSDPAIANHLITPVFAKWYGSAAMMEIVNIHAKIQKMSF